MPELPEIFCRAREMNAVLVGRRIEAVEVRQPKCLNLPVDAFRKRVCGAEIVQVSPHGKWIFAETTQGHLLLNLGMGGEILLVTCGALPETWRILLDLDQGDHLAVNFWWFGYLHYAAPGALCDHAMTAVLGPGALDLSLAQFRERVNGRRGGVKSFLLNQKNVAGIGNAYIHDILFRSGLHPLRTLPTLTDDEVARLHRAIRVEFGRSIEAGGAAYELDLFGERGGFSADDLLVGYREGKPCPTCGTPIEKIKTGSTSSFLCPACQPIGG